MERADSALRLNVHFHTLALDGVYVRDEEGELQFRELSAPTPVDVAQVAAWTHASLLRVLKRHGRSIEGVGDVDSFTVDQPALASCYGASAADVQQLGPAAGRKTDKLVRWVARRATAAPGRDPPASHGALQDGTLPSRTGRADHLTLTTQHGAG